MSSKTYLLLAAAAVALIFSAEAADPDITSDFIVPAETPVNADFFTYRGFGEALSGGPKEGSFKATKASKVEFPALDGQSVSLTVLQFAPRGLNPPHTHTRSAELLVVVQGTLSVGLIDSNNTLYSQFLFKGDSFVFPKGLVHFQVNVESRYPAVAISAFGSANPGTVSLPKALFGSGIENWILAQSLNTTTDIIDKIIAANSG
ncbi:putative germin-like protein 9-2 [Phalaenopsis equestris]|uniref:putative germin-like protein 9-2 n=1 Tax=Phalaenopsis equestris TaxID=78828 RepID=UPI0009E36323|nr:putative germin-like protein 9-2 [Phalaenopsis equestris]